MQDGNKEMIRTFDYSLLSGAFSKLARPAKRALINSRIYSPRELAQWTLNEIEELHGLGPSALPVLRNALRINRLEFKK